MKKMMILAAVVITAAITQAASVYWTCTGVYAGNETDKVGGIAYFDNGATLSQSALLALAGKDTSATDMANALSGSYSYLPGAAGAYTKTATAKVDVSALGRAVATTYDSLYLVIFDGATIADSKNFYMTQEMSHTTLSGTNASQIKFGAQGDSKVAGNWTAVAVPEPTSGLLLLLGMAGLALKRKRA